MKQFGFSAVVLTLVCAAMMTSCSKDGDSSSASEEVRFTAGIAGSPDTRTTNGGDYWASTDQVGIYMLTAGGTFAANVVAGNVPYKVTNVDNATADLVPAVSGDAIAYPLDATYGETDYDFIAYYPYGANSVATDGKYSVNLTDQIPPADIDVLIAGQRDVAKSTTPVNLTFTHILSKITINLKAGNGMFPADIAAITTVTLSGTPGTAVIDLNTAAGNNIAAGTNADITLYKEATATATFDATFTAIIVPHAAVTGRTLSAIVGDKTVVWDIPSTDAFVYGNNYAYSATVSIDSGGASSVNLGSSSIIAWISNERDELVEQEKQSVNRITWDADNSMYILTTDPTDAGLYFKFGSVVGIYSANGANQILPNSSNADIFDPTDIAWNPTDETEWSNIPRYDAPNTPIDATYHTAANVKAGKGDPCRLVGLDLDRIKSIAADQLTTDNIDNHTWRMPTSDESKTFSGYESSTTTSEHWTTLKDVIGGMFPDKTNGDATTFLPAAGRRSSGDNGEVQLQTTNGWYWLGDATGSLFNARGMTFSYSNVNPDSSMTSPSGLSVRCIRQ